ncbi:MAG: FAD-dependent oxidoreductase [Gammaproteobacteria bacterium]|nr:FAD-dependent oxidoreductase [Gammaproteobacteria bacterium]MBV9697999.1 FAD-dependent oxidoreductase [Gammaproteobacteria bacterium]
MARNPRYDVLFEPVQIGPVKARNRFYAVPHAAGMTNAMPHMRARFRETKAEGGWGVVCTGYVSIDPTSDDAPLPFATLWDDEDVRSHALMTEAVHRHGALAGIELWHGGGSVMNRTSRLPPMSPSGTAWMATHVNFMGNQRPRIMEAVDIRQLLTWQADAARRARRAGFDIVYVYAGMGYLPYEFLLPEWNSRTDAYGGSVANRVRLVRELLEATHEAVEGKCAVALRISLEELRARPSERAESEAHEVVQLIGDLPDLWDVKLDSSPSDCAPSRFAPEGSHEPIIGFVKSLTRRPVVGVGRFTSPDTMVGQIRRGVLDLIGAARPSIADPFLPSKIDEGREQDIRECIGCNICIASWHDSVPVRCTQNPTAGEEWRRGWHPERIARAASDASVLVVGAGPAGLECALALGRRGYEVTLAEAADELGGRLRFETRLPGLSAWGRVLEWRRGQLQRLANVNIYRGNRLTAPEILELAHTHVVIATGSRWSRRLYSALEIPVGELEGPHVLTPDDIAAGSMPRGAVVVYDFDNYYMGSVLAEHLARAGCAVRYVTPAGHASAWAIMSNEQPQIHRRFAELGIALSTLTRVRSFSAGSATLENQFTGATEEHACSALLIVGARFAHDELFHALSTDPAALTQAGIRSVTRIGDASAPGAIVHAVYSGHRFAEELDADPASIRYRRDAPLPARSAEAPRVPAPA